MANVVHKRGTRVNLDTLTSSSGLIVGQLYWCTNTSELFIATAVNAKTQVNGTGGGAVASNYVKTTDYTITEDLVNLFCDCTSNKITITLPAGTSNQLINIIKTDATINQITVLPNGTDKINGDTSMIIQYQNTAIGLTFYNGSWRAV